MDNRTIHQVLAARGETDTEIVRLIAEGRTDKEIGMILYLAHQTVRNRVSRILSVTGLLNRTQLAVRWLGELERDPDDPTVFVNSRTSAPGFSR